MRTTTAVASGRQVRVADVVCFAERGGCGEAEFSAEPQIVVPRRGVFRLHRGRSSVLADPLTAVVLSDEYRVSHPADGGDRCLAITVSADVYEEAIGPSRILPVRQRLRLTVATDELDGDETGMALLAQLTHAAPLRGSARIEQVREALGAEPARSWTLAEVAALVHVSPYHLVRQYKAATGQTIAQYLLGLRLALALDRLQCGEDDLARLSADLGFAGHSHFTERFRRAFGITPSQVRKNLIARRTRPT